MGNAKIELLQLIGGMSHAQAKQVLLMLRDTWVDESHLQEQRFTGDLACVHCGNLDVIHWGMKQTKDGIPRQRYRCKGCGKTFVFTTGTILRRTRKTLTTWAKYAQCLAYRLTLRDSAEICGFSLKTAFMWRHKILMSLGQTVDANLLSGVVEADETFVNLSFKGNYGKGKFESRFGRKAHHRGGEIHTRGTSKDKVCIPCAIDRSRVSLAVPACLEVTQL